MPKKKQYNAKSLYFSNRLEKIMSAFLGYPLTIVEAPMGYGKTTFVRESLKESDGNVLWQKVFDNSISGFWKGFCLQLGEVDHDRAMSLAALGFPSDSTTRYEAMSLIEAMKLQKDTVLVIDDYHLIAGSHTNEFIEFLVSNEIPYLHLILIGRHTGMQGIEELKLKGYLLHIEKAAFEFSHKDIEEYYGICGITLKENEVQMLYAMTEGWISALYLILLNYLENGNLDTTKNISKLIEHAVYRPLSEEVKELLLTLSMFDGFSLEQAIFVSKNQHAERLLEEIIFRNSFVNYDSKSKIYQIHHIFMNFLQDELERNHKQDEIYHRVAQWFSKMENYAFAQHYFYLCNDFESIYLTLEKEKYSVGNYIYSKELLINVLTECRRTIKAKHPFAMLALAFELYTYNEIDCFQKACEEFLEDIHRDNNIGDKEKNQLLGEYELLMSFTVYNDLQKMSIHHRKASELLKEPSSLLPRGGIWTFGSPSILYMFYRESGKLEEAQKEMFDALPLYSRVANGNASGGEYCMKAEGYFYRGDFENALITIHQAMHRAESQKQVSNIICSQFLRMRISLMEGNLNDILELIQKMHEEIVKSKEYLLLHTVEICEGYLYALLNQREKIPMWLQEGDYNSDRLLFPNYPMMNLVYGRALLLKGEYHKLIGSMENFIYVASIFPNLLGQIHTYIYVAAANWRIFRQTEALTTLKKALDLAIPDRLYMPFVENCDYIKSMLEELRRQNTYREAIEMILTLYKPYQQAIDNINREHFLENKAKLSEREMEIARLAAAGLTNKEIGEKLFVTENTVKMALKSIYAKLSINSRKLIKQCLNVL